MLKRLKEKQENPERDLISVFDVAILKYIGIYQYFIIIHKLDKKMYIRLFKLN